MQGCLTSDVSGSHDFVKIQGVKKHIPKRASQPSKLLVFKKVVVEMV